MSFPSRWRRTFTGDNRSRQRKSTDAHTYIVSSLTKKRRKNIRFKSRAVPSRQVNAFSNEQEATSPISTGTSSSGNEAESKCCKSSHTRKWRTLMTGLFILVFSSSCGLSSHITNVGLTVDQVLLKLGRRPVGHWRERSILYERYWQWRYCQKYRWVTRRQWYSWRSLSTWTHFSDRLRFFPGISRIVSAIESEWKPSLSNPFAPVKIHAKSQPRTLDDARSDGRCWFSKFPCDRTYLCNVPWNTDRRQMFQSRVCIARPSFSCRRNSRRCDFRCGQRTRITFFSQHDTHAKLSTTSAWWISDRLRRHRMRRCLPAFTSSTLFFLYVDYASQRWCSDLSIEDMQCLAYPWCCYWAASDGSNAHSKCSFI